MRQVDIFRGQRLFLLLTQDHDLQRVLQSRCRQILSLLPLQSTCGKNHIHNPEMRIDKQKKKKQTRIGPRVEVVLPALGCHC